jgi:cytochrome c-type biogenesis protein CcmH
MRTPFVLTLVGLLYLTSSAPGCNRAIEPYDPMEKVEQPDLARIFPEGARRVAEREQQAGQDPMGGPPPGPSGGRGAPPVAGGTGEPVRGTLVLSPELADSVPTGGVVFLVARSPEGGPPVAVQRIASPRFPLPFEIGPDDRMIQSIPFAGPLLLSARVDGDGNATSRQPGDLQGSSDGPVAPGDNGITIQIDERL